MPMPHGCTKQVPLGNEEKQRNFLALEYWSFHHLLASNFLLPIHLLMETWNLWVKALPQLRPKSIHIGRDQSQGAWQMEPQQIAYELPCDS